MEIWTIEVGSYSGINYDVIGCGGHNFLLLYGKDPNSRSQR